MRQTLFRIVWPLAMALLVIACMTRAAIAASPPPPRYQELPPPVCPQTRATKEAPKEFAERKNPFTADRANLSRAQKTYRGQNDNGANCAACHGSKGDGRGILSLQYMPEPRNFTCAATMKDVTDGQMFWIIRNGSPDTAMAPHRELTDDEIWQMIIYLRQFAK
jgi:mono/diheme cytochrome c family protein